MKPIKVNEADTIGAIKDELEGARIIKRKEFIDDNPDRDIRIKPVNNPRGGVTIPGRATEFIGNNQDGPNDKGQNGADVDLYGVKLKKGDVLRITVNDVTEPSRINKNHPDNVNENIEVDSDGVTHRIRIFGQNGSPKASSLSNVIDFAPNDGDFADDKPRDFFIGISAKGNNKYNPEIISYKEDAQGARIIPDKMDNSNRRGAFELILQLNPDTTPPPNRPPEVPEIPHQTSFDGASPTLTSSATDSDGFIASYSATGLPTGLTINSNTGVISGTIDPNASDTDDNNDGTQNYSVTVTATDDDNASTSQTFNWTVNNVAPDAEFDSYSTHQNTSLSVPVFSGVLNNDSDGLPDSDTLMVSASDTTSAVGGQVSVNDDGSFNYTPPDGFSGNDTFEYTVSDGNGGTDTATVNVNVIPLPKATLSISGSPFSEADGQATVTATLDRAAAQDVMIDLGFDGTATLNQDYTPSSSAIMIKAGELTGEINLDALDDAIIESDETITVDITDISDGAVENGIQQVQGLIVDNDVATLAISDGMVVEGDGGFTYLRFTITTDTLANQPLTGRVSTNDITAIAGSDYVPLIDAPFEIPAGTSFTQVLVPVLGDTIGEEDETFQATITSADFNGDSSSIIIADPIGIGLIKDNDLPIVTLSMNPTDIAEQGGTGEITATLDRPSPTDVIVNLAYSGEATLNQDYVAGNVIRIPAGNLTGTLSATTGTPLTAIDDVIVEVDETLKVEITSAIGAREVTEQVVEATILDPEDVATLSISDATMEEGDDGTTHFVFTLTTDTTAEKDIESKIFTADLTAIGGEDFSPLTNASVVIPAGQFSTNVRVPVMGDTLIEPDEIFGTVVTQASIDNDVSRVTMADPFGLGTILNDDVPNLILTTNVDNIAEDGGQAIITVSLDEPGLDDVEITLNFAGDATFGVDYTASTNTIVIPAGDTTGTTTVTLDALDDAVDELDEAVEISIASATNAEWASTTPITVTINDEDSTDATTILFVGDRDALIRRTTDDAIINRIENTLGGEDIVTVTAIDDDTIEAEGAGDISDYDLVVISETALSDKVVGFTNDLESATIGVLTWESHLYEHLGMAGTLGNQDYGFEDGKDITITNLDHPLAARLTGTVPVYKNNEDETLISWGRVNPNNVIATLPNTDKAAIFAYEAGDAMVRGTATGKRVGFFLHGRNNEFTNLTDEGLALFDAAVDYAAS